MDGDKYRMLLVDSDHERRTLMRRMLALCLRSWEFDEAGTLAEGLARLHPPPDCLLLDMDLADGAGEVILRKLHVKGLPTRVIVSTGAGDGVRLGGAAGLGPDAVLPKPIDAAGLNTICGLLNAASRRGQGDPLVG